MTGEERIEIEKSMYGRGIDYDMIQLIMADFSKRMSKFSCAKCLRKEPDGICYYGERCTARAKNYFVPKAEQEVGP